MEHLKRAKRETERRKRGAKREEKRVTNKKKVKREEKKGPKNVCAELHALRVSVASGVGLPLVGLKMSCRLAGPLSPPGGRGGWIRIEGESQDQS